MIERHVFIRLKSEHMAERNDIAEHTGKALAALPGVVSASVGIPADEHARAAWDLGITVRFQTPADAEAYHTHPDHVRLSQDYLQPRTAVIKAWNFDVTDVRPA